jgi:HSP20 family protein
MEGAMTEIEKTQEQAPVPAAPAAWDPFRLMREMLRWDPFRELAPYPTKEQLRFSPSFDVKETPEGFVFKADLPGIKEQDLEISLTGKRLNVTGKREVEERKEGEHFYSFERSYGSFSRTFTLPDGVQADKVHAELKDGVLTLMLPKKTEVKPKKIDIKVE